MLYYRKLYEIKKSQIFQFLIVFWNLFHLFGRETPYQQVGDSNPEHRNIFIFWSTFCCKTLAF